MLAIASDDFAKKCFNECAMKEFKLKKGIILCLLFNEKLDIILTLLKYHGKLKGYAGAGKNAN